MAAKKKPFVPFQKKDAKGTPPMKKGYPKKK